jgi:hypothetical protein
MLIGEPSAGRVDVKPIEPPARLLDIHAFEW